MASRAEFRIKYFILLNEFTLLRTLGLVLLRKPIYLIPSEAVFSPLSGLFNSIQTWLKSFSQVHSIFDLLPETRKYWKFSPYNNVTDIFARTEKAANDRFLFDDLEKKIGGYAMPYKHATCKYQATYFDNILLLKDISDKYSRNEAVFLHSNSDLLFTYEAYYGEKPRVRCKTAAQFRPLVNFASAMFVMLYLVSWSLRRLRLGKSSPAPVFLGADFTGAERQVQMVRDIVGDPGRCLFVFRNEAQRQACTADITGFGQCLNKNGQIPVLEVLSFFRFFVGDIISLYRRLRHLAPGHFLAIIKLVQKKAHYRALLNRFHFKYFWCRDDYNSEHIIRSQELRRVGSFSLGINHGLTSPLFIHPILRYIDYDIYYVFGKHLHQNYYLDTWSGRMIVKPVGSLCMTKDYLQRIDDLRPKDIAYFPAPTFNEHLMHEAIFSVARAFPDKTVYVKPIENRLYKEYYSPFLESVRNGPENLVESHEDSYDLIMKSHYVVSGRSSITAEAIQFGSSTFCFDFAGPDKPYYFRDFPGLCVSSAEEVIERISAIEAGKEQYPRHLFEDLIDLSGAFIIDVIREDIGLAPWEPPDG